MPPTASARRITGSMARRLIKAPRAIASRVNIETIVTKPVINHTSSVAEASMPETSATTYRGLGGTPVCGELSSSSCRELIQTSAVAFPPVLTEVEKSAFGADSLRFWRQAQRRMNSISVVVVPEVQQLPFEISGAPKRDLVQELSPYRADQSFNERMR